MENLGHPVHELKRVVHQRIRLSALAALYDEPSVDFVQIRETLGTSDGNLSTHLRTLSREGLITTTKTPGSPARTMVAITPKGRQALGEEVGALHRLLKHVDF